MKLLPSCDVYPASWSLIFPVEYGARGRSRPTRETEEFLRRSFTLYELVRRRTLTRRTVSSWFALLILYGPDINLIFMFSPFTTNVLLSFVTSCVRHLSSTSIIIALHLRHLEPLFSKW